MDYYYFIPRSRALFVYLRSHTRMSYLCIGRESMPPCATYKLTSPRAIHDDVHDSNCGRTRKSGGNGKLFLQAFCLTRLAAATNFAPWTGRNESARRKRLGRREISLAEPAAPSFIHFCRKRYSAYRPPCRFVALPPWPISVEPSRHTQPGENYQPVCLFRHGSHAHMWR